MSTAAATAVAFAVAGVLSFFAPRRLRPLLVVGVLLVPIALATPRFVRAERDLATASARGSTYSKPPGFRWRNPSPALVAGIVEHVPAHASVSIINARPETGWIRWLAYSIAPRQLTRGKTHWTIVFRGSPTEGGLQAVHAWAYGKDWLVEH